MAFELAPTVNPWVRYLDEQPKAAFLGAAQPWLAAAGNTRANQRSIDQVFQQTLSDFQTELGRRSLSNEEPNLLFSQFTGGLNPMDFTRRFAGVTDAIPSTQRFNPRTRRLYFS